MMLSFVGSIMPARVEDYVLAIRKGSFTLSNTLEEMSSNGLEDTSMLSCFVDKLEATVRRRLDHYDSRRLPRAISSSVLLEC
jgi:hypothetical protein